ncbi:MAG: asparagine synthase B [Chloroflexota bacterium]|nr:asparagine synthase B [Chloroflexota bacterium]
MCGIVAIHGVNANRWAYRIDGMLDRIAHRGPDDRGFSINDCIVLGQTRLSIIDVSGGKQPIANEDGSKCIVCNGEIYNYRDIKNGLHHHSFKTRSDTEAVLHLYEDIGDDVAMHLDGMFAFAIKDGEDILVARDPIGIKPLYQGEKDGCRFFASEIKALEGIVDCVEEFPAGHCYSSRTGLRKYYELPQVADYEEDINTIVIMLREKLSAAVQKRFMSDVPLGVFLSGGLDSSLISAVTRKHFDHLNSFCVGMKDSTDIQYARQVAEFIGTKHHEYVYDRNEVIDALPKVVYHLESFDPALVRSAIPTYFVSKLASEYVKVILTGEGSDEVFAGYRYFKDIEEEEVLHGECLRILSGLHNLNLQRVDRVTMAHSIEGRVPFLDIDFVEYATSISPELKLADDSRMEKWLLRKAFTGYLPDEVLWRTKTEFADGCASAHIVEEFVEDRISDSEYQLERNRLAPIEISSKEELYYFRLFHDFFGTDGLEQTVGKWKGRLEEEPS